MVLKRKRCTLIDKQTSPKRISPKMMGSVLHSKDLKKTDDTAASVMVKKKVPASASSTKIFKSTVDSPKVSQQAMTSGPKESGIFATTSNVIKKKATDRTKIIDRKKRPTKKKPSASKNGRKRTNTQGRKKNKKESVKRKRNSKMDKKKKKKKKDQEKEEEQAQQEEESEESDSDESIANGGIVCRNCSRGTVEQVDPCAAMHNLELPEIFALENGDNQ